MKEVIFGDSIQETPKLQALAEKAMPILDEVIGKHAAAISAVWDRGRGLGRRDLLVLRLSDETSSAVGVFTPEDLQTPAQMESPLRWVWMDLLRFQNHKDLEALHAGKTQEGS